MSYGRLHQSLKISCVSSIAPGKFRRLETARCPVQCAVSWAVQLMYANILGAKNIFTKKKKKKPKIKRLEDKHKEISMEGSYQLGKRRRVNKRRWRLWSTRTSRQRVHTVYNVYVCSVSFTNWSFYLVRRETRGYYYVNVTSIGEGEWGVGISLVYWWLKMQEVIVIVSAISKAVMSTSANTRTG